VIKHKSDYKNQPRSDAVGFSESCAFLHIS